MKEGTKLILEKLKDPKTYADNIDPSLIIDKVEELEKKLLQVEKYLNLGGIIADKNGKPCKDGDVIRIYRYGTFSVVGPIHFDHVIKAFTVMEGDRGYWCLNERQFELVEQSEKIDI
jgi:hypothetical protein